VADVALVRLLSRGVQDWNRERPRGQDLLDLTHVDIFDADLVGIDLCRVDLNGSRLERVDLKRADLRRTRLNGMSWEDCSLAAADLTDSELLGTDMTRVDMQRAKFQRCRTRELKIRHAILASAVFDDATVETMHIFNSDLTGLSAAGLTVTEDAMFRRVIVDDDCIERLRRAGVRLQAVNEPHRVECLDPAQMETILRSPEAIGRVDYRGRAHWIVGERFHFFVSHATADKVDVAFPLKTALERRGRTVWYDVDQIRLADGLESVINYGIRSSVHGVIVISPRFFARRWTEFELAALVSRPNRIFLVLHGVQPEAIGNVRPELADRRMLTTDGGLDAVADQLIEAATQPPREIG
jgi:hypothetical protein